MNLGSSKLLGKSLWQFPWAYAESFLVIMGFSLLGLMVDLLVPTGTPKIIMPINLILFYGIIGFSFLLFWLSKKHAFYKWFYSIPAAVASTVMFVVASLLIALIPQQKDIGFKFLYDVTSSWGYLFSITLLLIILGTTIIKRLSGFSAKKDLGFLLNHLGLWLCLAVGHLGAGDIETYSVAIKEGETTKYAYDKSNHKVELGFAVKLHDFIIEEYPAKLALSTGSVIIKKDGKPVVLDIAKDFPFSFEHKVFTVKSALMNSVPVNNQFEEANSAGATQSVLVDIQDDTCMSSHWISGFSNVYPPLSAQVNDSVFLVMLKANVKTYISNVTLYANNNLPIETSIEVNKPAKINGWKIYQVGYDEEQGKWSDVSVFEIIKDPWLKFVYAGFFLMIGGALYIIWFGKLNKK